MPNKRVCCIDGHPSDFRSARLRWASSRQRFHDQPGNTELGTHAVHVVIGGMLADVKPGQGCAHMSHGDHHLVHGEAPELRRLLCGHKCRAPSHQCRPRHTMRPRPGTPWPRHPRSPPACPRTHLVYVVDAIPSSSATIRSKLVLRLERIPISTKLSGLMQPSSKDLTHSVEAQYSGVSESPRARRTRSRPRGRRLLVDAAQGWEGDGVVSAEYDG